MSFFVFPEMVPYGGEATLRPRAASMVPYGEATQRPRSASLAAPSGPPIFSLKNPLEASELAWRQQETEFQNRGAASLQTPRPFSKFQGSG